MKKPGKVQGQPSPVGEAPPGRRDRRTRLVVALFLLGALGFGAYQVGWLVWGESQLRAARHAEEERDFPRARAHLARYLRAWPSDPSALMQAARLARRDGALEEARRLLGACLEAGGVAQAVDLEGKLVRLQSGDLREAETYTRFCAGEPDNPETPLILEALIVGSLRGLDLPRARRCLAQWRQRATSVPDRVQGLVWSGELALRSAEPEQALASFREAVELDPNHDGARRRLAEMLTNYSPREAVAHLEELRRRHPDDDTLTLLLARCWRALGEHEKAQALLDPLLSRDPQNVPALVERGSLALDLNRLDEAERRLRQAHALAPDQRDANVALARCLRLAGKEAEARACLDRVDKLDAELQRRAEALLKTGRPAQGEAPR